MVSQFMADLAADVQGALADMAEPLTLKRGSSSFTCSGFSAAIDLTRVTGTGVIAGDLMVTVLADTLTVTPKAGDVFTIGGRARAVISAAQDPAGTVWSVQVRG